VLDTISTNARPSKKAARTRDNDPKQMQISLGQEVQKKCKDCGMEYIPSSAEDRKLHDKHHKQATQGYDVGKDFVAKARPKTTWPGLKPGDQICSVDCYDDRHRIRRGQAALEMVQRELGAVDLPKDRVWKPLRDYIETGDPPWVAYLYVRNTKCIGFLLVQKIKEAFSIVQPTALASSPAAEAAEAGTSALATLKAREDLLASQLKQPIELSTEANPAQLGISRIWVSPPHRHTNIATTLLDTAYGDYNDRAHRQQTFCKDWANMCRDPSIGAEERRTREILHELTAVMTKVQSKDEVAFSQPTEAGVRLARRWFGKPFRWSVYVD